MIDEFAAQWECLSCGQTVRAVARVFCTDCGGYHEVCLDCAPDVEIDGRKRRVREQVTAWRGSALPVQTLMIVSIGGSAALCGARPSA